MLLRLPDPHQHIDRLKSVRRLLDIEAMQTGLEVRFGGRFRSQAWRKAARRLLAGGYFVFSFLAVLPLLAVSVYQLLYVPETVSAEEFPRIAGQLYWLFAISLPVFGYMAFECIWSLDRMRKAERLVEAVREFASGQKRGSRVIGENRTAWTVSPAVFKQRSGLP